MTISWDEYFINIAIAVAAKSKDPNTKVGAVLCDSMNRIVGCGFNGPPPGIPDDKIPWGRDGSALNTKYIWICHAEANCIDFSDQQRAIGGKLYTTLFPCADCCKRIIKAKIQEVIYLYDLYHNDDSYVASRKMFDWAGVKYRQFIKQ